MFARRDLGDFTRGLARLNTDGRRDAFQLILQLCEARHGAPLALQVAPIRVDFKPGWIADRLDNMDELELRIKLARDDGRGERVRTGAWTEINRGNNRRAWPVL